MTNGTVTLCLEISYFHACLAPRTKRIRFREASRCSNLAYLNPYIISRGFVDVNTYAVPNTNPKDFVLPQKYMVSTCIGSVIAH